jgi:hypothetical protein
MSGWDFTSLRLCAGFGVALSVGLISVSTASAQTSLDAGKTPAQIFASDCSPCHKSPQGLFKGALGLSSFLRQHYTASKENAEALAAYLGAVDKGGPAAATTSRKRDAKPPAKRDEKKEEAGESTPESAEGATEAKPARKPAAKKPDAKPEAKSDAKPAAAKPAEAKPADAKPAEAKPEEAKPAASAPAESKPAEAPAAKPAE